jgi:fluoride exporter
MQLIIDPNLEKILLISAGAVLGANARYWLSIWAAEKWGSALPYGTFLVNVSGSLLLGLFLALISERLVLDPRWRLLIAVGFLGAYTTFSTYAFESFDLLSRGQWQAGLINLLGSAFAGLAAVLLGVWLGKRL